MSNVMTVKDLCLWYGSAQALKDINIEIEERSITALIGPSGCGKSTFLKSLNRMNDLITGVRITGEVCYRNYNIFDADIDVSELRRSIGMVFQKPNPFPMSIYDNIAYGPRTHGIKNKAKLDDIVEHSLRGAAIWEEVKDRLKKSALGLSGGQQQRVALARALVVNPSVLLLDEPLSALDAKIRVQLRDEIRAIQQKLGITAIFVTHDQEEALAIADRVAVMHDGHLEQIGTPYELYVSPATPFVADFIGQSNKLETRVLPNGMVDVLGFDVPLLRPLDANTPVTVFVRPENVVLRRPDAGNGDHVVHSSMFLGAFERTEVRVGTVSLVSQHAAGERFSPGERVSVEIRPEPVAAEPIDSAWARHATMKADIRVNAGAGERQS